MKLLLTISYLGTRYHGFQVQPNGITVQSTLQDAVERVFGYRCPVTGCSRTDSGVHANMFCCTVETCGAPNRVPTEKVAAALNSVLPDDIAVRDVCEKPDGFHPRYDVVSKEYVYLINNSPVKDPFSADRAYHYPVPLDTVRMNEAAAHLVGEHDFAAFCASGSSVKDTVRNIFSCSVNRDENTVVIRICGNGFLYNMVRIVTGTLIYVSEGKLSPEDIDGIILSRDRHRAGFTAPAHGLYLNRVSYN